MTEANSFMIFIATSAICLAPLLLWHELKERRRHRLALRAIHKKFAYEKLIQQIGDKARQDRWDRHIFEFRQFVQKIIKEPNHIVAYAPAPGKPKN